MRSSDEHVAHPFAKPSTVRATMTVCLKVCLNAVSAVLALAVPAVEEVGLALVQAARVRSCGAPSLQRSAAKLDLSCNHLMRSCQQPGRNCLNARRRIMRITAAGVCLAGSVRSFLVPVRAAEKTFPDCA